MTFSQYLYVPKFSNQHSLIVNYTSGIEQALMKWDLSLSEESFNHYTIDTPVEDLWHSLCNLLKSVLFPSKMITGAPKKPWINRRIKQLRRRKQRQYNLAKQTNSERQWKHFTTLKKLMHKECRIAHNQYMHHTIYDHYHNGRKRSSFNMLSLYVGILVEFLHLKRMALPILRIFIKQMY